MAITYPVTPDDILVVLGRGTEMLSVAERDMWQVLIDAAVVRLQQEATLRGYDFAKLVASNPALVALTIKDAVARVVRNPAAVEGYRAESEGSYSYTLASPLETAANIWFPDKDLALLMPLAAAGRVGTIFLGRPVRPW